MPDMCIPFRDVAQIDQRGVLSLIRTVPKVQVTATITREADDRRRGVLRLHVEAEGVLEIVLQTIRNDPFYRSKFAV